MNNFSGVYSLSKNAADRVQKYDDYPKLAAYDDGFSTNKFTRFT